MKLSRTHLLVGAGVVVAVGLLAWWLWPGRTYTVTPGDTLDDIAHRFGTTYQALAARNGIADPDVIEVGQVLKVG